MTGTGAPRRLVGVGYGRSTGDACVRQYLNLVRGHNDYVNDRIDLVASNAWVSQFVRATMGSSLTNSYCIGFPGNRFYGGCSYIDMIEREVVGLAKRLFSMKHAVVQFLSGMQANIGAYNALLKAGDTVVAAPPKHGGHYSHSASGPLRMFHPKVVSLPFDETSYNIDPTRLDELFAREKPSLLILGWSEFLFEHPLAEVRAICDRHGVKLMYDMSHVAGLVAAGVFQADVHTHADIITSSTGKSFHAPDHGMVLYNDDRWTAGVLEAVMPLLTSNTHPQEMAALGMVLHEWAAHGPDYGRQVVENTKALGHALAGQGIDVLYGDHGYSNTHMLLVRYESPGIAVAQLDSAGIICNACDLPWDPEGVSSGLRLGTQVLTRRGMGTAQMEVVAQAIADVLIHRKDPGMVQMTTVKPLARGFDHVAFSHDFHFPLEDGWFNSPFQHLQLESAVEIVRTLPVFAALQPDVLERMTEMMDLVRLDRQQTLFAKGEKADSVYFLYRGQVEIIDESDGKISVVGQINTGDPVGLRGVLHGLAYPHTIRADAGSVLVRISETDLQGLMSRHPAIELALKI